MRALDSLQVEVIGWPTRFVGGDGAHRRVFDEPVTTDATVRSVLRGLSGRFPELAAALWHGTELGEHDSPPEATLQVLTGRVRLIGLDREWELTAGELAPIPPERHSLAALEDSAVLLTVLRS